MRPSNFPFQFPLFNFFIFSFFPPCCSFLYHLLLATPSSSSSLLLPLPREDASVNNVTNLNLNSLDTQSKITRGRHQKTRASRERTTTIFGPLHLRLGSVLCSLQSVRFFQFAFGRRSPVKHGRLMSIRPSSILKALSCPSDDIFSRTRV